MYAFDTGVFLASLGRGPSLWILGRNCSFWEEFSRKLLLWEMKKLVKLGFLGKLHDLGKMKKLVKLEFWGKLHDLKKFSNTCEIKLNCL